jgi:nucleoside-diphosphate-sugar epimerase
MASGEAKGETVMVTGASGFIGSTLVRGLLDRGYAVRAGVLNPGQSVAPPLALRLRLSFPEARRRSAETGWLLSCFAC